MKRTTSKFLSVLIPAQSLSPSKSSNHQDFDQEKLQPHFKRKNPSESHHPNKRSRVTIHIPYTPDLKNLHRSRSQTNLQHHELSSNKLNPSETSRPSSTKQDFSPLNDSEDENDLTPFETHSPGSTRQTTVSLSRPQSPTLGYDSDFNPIHSSPPSDDEYESDKESHSNQTQLPAVMSTITFSRFKNYFRQIKLVESQVINEDQTPQLINPDQTNHLDITSEDLSWTEDQPIKTSERGEEFYSSVKFHHTIINLSQVVILKNQPCNLTQYKISGLDHYSLEFDSQPDSKPFQHFFLIESLFERDGKKFFHGIRLQEASDTFLGQSADDHELVLIDQCFEFELILIHELLDVQFTFSDQKSINPSLSKRYHCRYRWLPTEGAFVQLEKPPPPLLTTSSDSFEVPNSPSALCRRCISIPREIDWIRDPHTHQIVLGPDDQHLSLGFIINGTKTYKLWDYISFVKSSSTKGKEQIGQIIEISEIRSNLNPSIDLTDEEFQVPLKEYTRLENSLKNKSIKLLVKVYARKPWPGTRMDEDDYFYLDDCRLWITDTEEIVDGLNEVVGKCQIDHFVKLKDDFSNLNSSQSSKPFCEQIQNIRTSPNRFYSILPTQTQQNQTCSVPNLDSNLIPYLSFRNQIDQVEEKIELKELVQDYDQMKLSHLELFGGIGSFSLGFSENGLTEEKSTMFIDWSIPACETASINFPESKVFCADVNDILSLMMNGKTRSGRSSVKDLRTGSQIFPDQLPKPGDFDLITAGFPCGGHSTLNVLRKGEDSKNALCGTAISFVEYLKPTYVYFENVRGLLKTQLVDHQSHQVLTHAFLRLICGTMITLDYQLRFGVLQAAQYGTPQERRRLIFIASRRGTTLPRLPEPTHYYPDNRLQIKLPDQNKITMDFRNKLSRGILNAITVGDTISDLPLFEYRNPKKIMGDFDRRTRIKLKERERICPLKNGSSPYAYVEKTDWVGFKRFFYRLDSPINNFQTYLRSKRNHEDKEVDGSEVEEVLNWHVTGRLSEKVIEQIWHIPMKEGADYKDLPKQLRYKEAEATAHRTQDYSKDFEGNFGRLGHSQLFRTMITKMDPKNQGRTGQVLHPSQHRVLTVLEAQRAQGFPDWFKLSNKSEGVKGLYKQIGNSIPLPITRSLGLSLWESREIDWNRDGKKVNEEMNEMILLDLMEVWKSFLN